MVCWLKGILVFSFFWYLQDRQKEWINYCYFGIVIVFGIADYNLCQPRQMILRDTFGPGCLACHTTHQMYPRIHRIHLVGDAFWLLPRSNLFLSVKVSTCVTKWQIGLVRVWIEDRVLEYKLGWVQSFVSTQDLYLECHVNHQDCHLYSPNCQDVYYGCIIIINTQPSVELSSFSSAESLLTSS